ncbi:cytochrome b6-f complex iron-sulfur subunit [mine drainage metagenome]|uniref:Cytochrome b6-f complex iron-sulfur subunit n=1 Tax=mine drainage metagenome TaxID=410659 RepID=A0A1J5PN98_9ZZZZ
MTSIADSYRNQSLAARVLRVWLGVTFLYAGWNKASDGAFFTSGSSHYIGSQLAGFAHGSPIGPLLNVAAQHPMIFGWLTLLAEMAIGIAVLLNVASMPAAIAGALLSLTLWLSSSWHVHPYFLGSDSAYFVMWGAYVLMLLPSKEVPVRARGRTSRATGAVSPEMGRREVVRIAAVGGLAIFGGLLGRLLKSSPRSATSASQSPASQSSSANASTSTSSGTTTGGHVLASLSSLAVGSAVNFTANNGDPAVLIRTGKAKVCAFDAICTHNGCTVEYDPGSQTLICPCHGAQYDPLSHAAVLAGPAPAPLAEIPVKIDGTNIVLA